MTVRCKEARDPNLESRADYATIKEVGLGASGFISR
jgi:hypothetical protein